MNLSVIAILWFGGIRVNIGSLTQGEVIAFVNYITQILLSLIVFSQLIVIFYFLSEAATTLNIGRLQGFPLCQLTHIVF